MYQHLLHVVALCAPEAIRCHLEITPPNPNCPLAQLNLAIVFKTSKTFPNKHHPMSWPQKPCISQQTIYKKTEKCNNFYIFWLPFYVCHLYSIYSNKREYLFSKPLGFDTLPFTLTIKVHTFNFIHSFISTRAFFFGFQKIHHFDILKDATHTALNSKGDQFLLFRILNFA